MEKERLVVKNFGPITNLDIEIRPLTLFIGTQGSGKSTVSKLLTICRDMRWWINILENNQEGIIKPFIDFGINEYFHDDSFFLYHNVDVEICYTNGSYSFYSEGKDDIGALKATLKRLIVDSSMSLMKKDELPSDELPDLPTLKFLRANTRLGLYIPAERNLAGNLSNSLASIVLNKIPLSDIILEYLSIFEKAKKYYPSYDIPFLKVKFVKKNGLERIELTGTNVDLPLLACSSGLQSAIPMLMIIDYVLKANCFDSFVIEEPEQNLFPKNQFEMLGFITSKLWHPSKYRKFIITTHSPYLLSSLNLLMLAYKLQHIEEVREEAEKIIVPGYTVNPDDVAVYSLDPESEEYCKSLISEKTGLVSVNELDSVSEVIGDDFDRLYVLYRQVNKKK